MKLRCLSFFVAVCTFGAATAAPAATATLTGLVSNRATGQYLEGATVTLADLGRVALTDPTGRYRFADVPVGDHRLAVTYTGLMESARTVRLDPAGTRADFELAAGVLQLERFTVVSEREGQAAAITRQRTAPNIKNVIALDALGILPNDNLGELLTRLPGVAGEIDDSGEILGVQIRGADSVQSTVTVDGVRMMSGGGFHRDFQINKMPGALFSEIEVTKASTPDMDADSIGGAVNLRTRSPLALKERYRVSYRLGARWAPPFLEHVPFARDDPLKPNLSATFQGKFRLFSAEPNLGVSLSGFHSRLSRPSRFTRYAYNPGITVPHFTPTFVTHDTHSPRDQTSLNLKLEYRLSERTRLFVNTLFNDADNTGNRRHLAQAVTGSTLVTFNAAGAPTGTGTIYPGYTDTFTRVRGTTASVFTVTESANRFYDAQRQVHFGAEHEFGRLRLNYEANFSRSKTTADDRADGGIFSQRVRSVGWTLDAADPRAPVFTQTEGPSIFDIANYDNGNITWRNNHSLARIVNVGGNVTYETRTRVALTLKSGLRFRRETSDSDVDSRLWTYLGPDGILGNADDALAKFVDPGIRASQWTGARALPFPGAHLVVRDVLQNPAHWRIDPYRTETQRLMGLRALAEEVGAAYVQAQARYGALRLLTGVRVERTAVEGTGNVQARFLSTTAQRTADPLGSARADWDNPRVIRGRYSNTFPGLHLAYHFGPGLLARASWSTGISRPPMGNLVPRETANNTAQTLTINNPSLRPQYTDNFDLSLERYFEPVGLVTVSAFRKSLRDYIVNREAGIVGHGTDNGYNGDYAGFSLVSPFNAGTARIEGVEFAYQQQLTFLPGVLKGLGLNASYTRLRTEGDFGTATPTSTSEVPGFIPEAANASVSYTYRRFAVRYLFNYTGAYFVAFNADPSLMRYKYSRVAQNVNTTFSVRRGLDLFCNVENLANAPVSYYYHARNRPERTIFTGTFVSFGITGSF